MGVICAQNVTLNIIGGEIPCKITMDESLEQQVIELEDALPGLVRRIAFMYSVGKPKRTVFASSYTKRRVGGASGDPPDLGDRSFSHQPFPNLEPTDVRDAEFIVTIPSYSNEVEALHTGTDIYDITLWLREANVRIGGTNPPPNLQPPNPM